MSELMRADDFKRMLIGKSLYELEAEKLRLEKIINDKNLDKKFRKTIYGEYLRKVEDLISEEVNQFNNRKPFKISQLKYTKHHWMSGEIVNGCPITTSIEIKPETSSTKLKLDVLHKYILENQEIKTIKKEHYLPNQEKTLEILEQKELRSLKNNYFSDDPTERFRHWELEYNSLFKISGTFDQEPKAIKEIVRLLRCDFIINEVLSEVEKKIKN